MQSENGIAILENCLIVPKNFQCRATNDPEIPLLGQEKYTSLQHTHTKTCIWMLIARFCKIALKWKQPKYSPTDKWINKTWYVHTIEYYSPIKSNRISIHATIGIYCENIKWKKLVPKVTYYGISFIWNVQETQKAGESLGCLGDT
jgi:hypothetical protein